MRFLNRNVDFFILYEPTRIDGSFPIEAPKRYLKTIQKRAVRLENDIFTYPLLYAPICKM